MQIKRTTALLLAMIPTLALIACGSSQTADKPSDTAGQLKEASENAKKDANQIGIVFLFVYIFLDLNIHLFVRHIVKNSNYSHQ